MAKRGRPPKGPFSDKLVGFGTRITKETRAKLEAATKQSGRSLSQEAEMRLCLSFEDEDMFGGPITSWVLQSISNGIADVEAQTNRRWYEDPYTFDECHAFITGWMNRLRLPKPSRTARPKRRPAIHDSTPPSEIALHHTVLATMVPMVAPKANLPSHLLRVGSVLGKRLEPNLTATEIEEVESMRASLKTEAGGRFMISHIIPKIGSKNITIWGARDTQGVK